MRRISNVVVVFCFQFCNVRYIDILVCCVVYELLGPLFWWGLLAIVLTMAWREAIWWGLLTSVLTMVWREAVSSLSSLAVD